MNKRFYQKNISNDAKGLSRGQRKRKQDDENLEVTLEKTIKTVENILILVIIICFALRIITVSEVFLLCIPFIDCFIKNIIIRCFNYKLTLIAKQITTGNFRNTEIKLDFALYSIWLMLLGPFVIVLFLLMARDYLIMELIWHI